MVAGEVENSCQLVVTFFFFFFFFFFLVSPYQTIEISLGQPSGTPPHINYFLRRWRRTQHRILVCWNRCKIELHAGLKAFGMQLLKNGLSRRRFASVNWDGLHLKHSSIWTLYSIYHKRTAMNFSRYFHFNTLATRSHTLTLNLASSTINAFRHSFFVTTPFLWNSIPFEILSQRTAGSFKTRLKHYLFL